MLLGYNGWASSHGLNWVLRNETLNNIADSPFSNTLAQNMDVSYIVNSNNFSQSFQQVESTDFWTKIYEDNCYQVWKIVQ